MSETQTKQQAAAERRRRFLNARLHPASFRRVELFA
jgi:hypothetical protein